jgi:hypothetical protein
LRWIRSLNEAVARSGVDREQLIPELHEALLTGDLEARLLQSDGTVLRAAEPQEWVLAQIDWPMFLLFTVDSVELTKDPPDAWLAFQLEPHSFQVLFATSQIPGRQGGRPRKWDWEAFWIELAARVYYEGLPPTDSELAASMLQWFSAHSRDGDAPSDSEVRKRIAQLRRRFNSR